MNPLLGCLTALFALPLLTAGAFAEGQRADVLESRVCLVVTGLRVEEGPERSAVDPSVAKDAEVTLAQPGGATKRRTTAPLQRGGQVYYTADFEVAFDTTYELTLTFKGGPTIAVKDYRVASEWTKVPIFTFNSTTGTKSPAAVLRCERDPRTGLGCYVYALWPLDNYRKVGGRQLGP